MRTGWPAVLLALVVIVGCSGGAAPAAPVPAAGGPAPTSAPASGGPGQPAAATPNPARRLEMVRVGTIANATDAPFYLAQERGYLREQGLDLEVQPFDSAQLMIAPLGADQLDVGGGGPGPGLFNAFQRGIGVRVVTDRARAVPGTRFNCLVVRKGLLDSGEVRGMADLRGRVFAQPVPGTVTTYVLEKSLRQAGVAPNELEYVTMAFPDMLSGFANGAIDATFTVEPFITLAEQRGLADCWHPTSELEPDFQIAVVLYGPGFAERRGEVGRRFMVAYLRAMRDYYRAFFGDGQGRSELLELLTRITSVRDTALLERLAPSWMDPNGSVNVASLRAVQAWYRERGDLTGEADLDRVVDMSFVDYAVSQLGRYQ